jgi:hypothetical protein
MRSVVSSGAGERRKWIRSLFFSSGGWRGSVLLQLKEKHTAAMLATVICDRSGGLSRRSPGVSSNFLCVGPSKILAKSSSHSRRQVVVPGGAKAFDDGGSPPVERTRD